MAERWEWVEIIEPRTKEHMYANLATGECVWDPPPGVKIKKTDDNQWWELFDQNTSRFYYYNATSQKTVWHRPQNCDIIPLAKLQTLKQNTEVRDTDDDHRPRVKKEIATQTPERQPKREHMRTGSLRSSNSTQTSPHSRRQHRHHHHHHKQDTLSSTSSSQASTGRKHGNYSETFVNGERRRRGSESSRASVTYMRRDSVETPPQRSLESPRPHQRSLAMDLHTVHRGMSLDASSGTYGYSRDDMTGYPQQQQDTSRYPDVSQITAVQVTPRPKPRSFPRTNPAYVGVHRRDGAPSYKRINIETSAPPTAIYNQRFYGDQPSHPALDVALQTSGAQTTQTYISDLAERHLHGGYRHDRSDSDTSHSSYGRIPSEMTDSFISHSSGQIKSRDHSDSHSSQGSLRNIQDSHSSSQGSLRSGHERDHLSSPHSSPRHQNNNMEIIHDNSINTNNTTTNSNKTQRGIIRRNSEPDYANLPIVPIRPGGKIITVDDPITKHEQEKISSSVLSEDEKYDDFRSGDSLSPEEYRRQDTPSSIRSRSTQNSTSQSHTSEGHTDVFSNPFLLLGLPDQGYEDSDSSVFSTPSPTSKNRGISPSLLPMETQHASLKRKKIPEPKSDSGSRTPMLEKSQSLQQEIALQRPLSMVIASQSEANVIVNPATGSLQRQNGTTAPPGTPIPPIRTHKRSTSSAAATGIPSLQRPVPGRRVQLHSESDIESYEIQLNRHRKGLFGRKMPVSNMLCYTKTEIERYAQENLNKHKKGLLGKKVPMANMLAWSKEEIKKPMIKTNDKVVKRESTEVFKLIQMYMGDRKSKSSLPNLAWEITNKGWSMPSLRDEIYIQLCRQTTENNKDESLMRGWELMGICLAFFPPSVKFHSYLEGYIYRHLDPSCDTEKVPVSHFAAHCQRRLDRISQTGPKRGLRKPNLEEIEQAKKSIFHPSMFGSTLEDVMLMQKDRFPDNKLPWIQTILSEEVLRLNGAQTEGIFRVPGDIDEVNALKVRCDQWIPPTDCPDPHIPASLLKLWYRELYDPLIPSEFYEQCVQNYANPEAAIDIVDQLPHINKMVLGYLIRFLQVFSAEENALVTKMDTNNLAMVMAPNCLRCESEDPRIIFENTRKEMAYVRILIQSLDTSFVEGIL